MEERKAMMTKNDPVVTVGTPVDRAGRHFCMLQSMKQVSRNQHSVTLKCRGCGSPIMVKLTSSVYRNWKNLTGAKEEKRDEQEDKC